MPEFLINRKRFFIAHFLSMCFFLFIFYGVFLSAPYNFPVDKMVVIPKGTTVLAAGELLKENRIISYPSIFSMIVKITSPNDAIIAGGYIFRERESVITVGRRLATGRHELDTIKITFPEGLTVKEMAKLCKDNLPLCDEKEFIKLGASLEGYLYPDTYFFIQSSIAEDVIQMMKDTFNQKILQLDKEIKSFDKSEKDILIMASILEKEAQNFENRKAVASILWKRISIGMPLQADATLQYETGKNTYQLTTEDLAKKSPYNSYTSKGLPPTPIANPSIESIRAAITIKPTKYLYYLTDKSGNFYFAETHEQHVINKQKYLNSF